MSWMGPPREKCSAVAGMQTYTNSNRSFGLNHSQVHMWLKKSAVTLGSPAIVGLSPCTARTHGPPKKRPKWSPEILSPQTHLICQSTQRRRQLLLGPLLICTARGIRSIRDNTQFVKSPFPAMNALPGLHQLPFLTKYSMNKKVSCCCWLLSDSANKHQSQCLERHSHRHSFRVWGGVLLQGTNGMRVKQVNLVFPASWSQGVTSSH